MGNWWGTGGGNQEKDALGIQLHLLPTHLGYTLACNPRLTHGQIHLYLHPPYSNLYPFSAPSSAHSHFSLTEV